MYITLKTYQSYASFWISFKMILIQIITSKYWSETHTIPSNSWFKNSTENILTNKCQSTRKSIEKIDYQTYKVYNELTIHTR